ncbi:MAG: hypothetical protein WBO97_15975, partial [Tepidiformaceae bacterium]
RRKRREEADRRDAEIYARMAADPEIQREIEENLALSVQWWELGDAVELLPDVEARLAREERDRSVAAG